MAKKNYDKALAALLSTSTIAEAAKKSGLSEATLYRYLADDEFQRLYRKARRSLVESSIGQIQAATGEAVETLRIHLTCKNPIVAVRAAQIILATAYKGVELLDILDRLETLEREVDDQKENFS